MGSLVGWQRQKDGMGDRAHGGIEEQGGPSVCVCCGVALCMWED